MLINECLFHIYWELNFKWVSWVWAPRDNPVLWREKDLAKTCLTRVAAGRSGSGMGRGIYIFLGKKFLIFFLVLILFINFGKQQGLHFLCVTVRSCASHQRSSARSSIAALHTSATALLLQTRLLASHLFSHAFSYASSQFTKVMSKHEGSLITL